MTTKPYGGAETRRHWIFRPFSRYSHALLALDYSVWQRGDGMDKAMALTY